MNAMVTNNVTPSGQSAQEVGLDPRSLLGFLFEKRPLASGSYVYGAYEFPSDNGTHSNSQTLIMMGLDIGNSGVRTAVLHPERHTLAFSNVPTNYLVPQQIIYGEHAESWVDLTSGDGALFCIGEYAKGGQSLPIGPTSVRLADRRSMNFVKASLVRGLIEAGYKPGHYAIGLVVGVRNEELTVGLGVDPAVDSALDFLRKPFSLRRNKDEWHIHIRELVPLPQTFGSYYALNTGITGQPLTDLPRFTVFDLGFHDGHILEISLETGLQVTGQRVSSGVVDVARGLVLELRKAENFPLIASDLSDAEAIELLHSEKLLIGGAPLADKQEEMRAKRVIQSYKDREGQALIATMLSRHVRLDSKFLFSGGGNAEFKKQILSQLSASQRPTHLYQIVPPELARFANVAGIYWALNIRKRLSAVAG
jgi:hypothetical protein